MKDWARKEIIAGIAIVLFVAFVVMGIVYWPWGTHVITDYKPGL